MLLAEFAISLKPCVVFQKMISCKLQCCLFWLECPNSENSELWKLTFAHKLTFVAVFWIKRLFYNFHILIVHVSEKCLLKAIISQGHSAGRGAEGGPGSFFSCCHASTILVSLKVHIPPDDTFSAERKTCYLLGKYGIRFFCNISFICVDTDRILD